MGDKQRPGSSLFLPRWRKLSKFIRFLYMASYENITTFYSSFFIRFYTLTCILYHAKQTQRKLTWIQNVTGYKHGYLRSVYLFGLKPLSLIIKIKSVFRTTFKKNDAFTTNAVAAQGLVVYRVFVKND